MTGKLSTASPAHCPSAQPPWKGSTAIGVAGGTADDPRVAFFAEPLPVSEELLKLTGTVSATEVFRFAAPCVQAGCAHFQSGRCHLVEKTVEVLAPVVSHLPECGIRVACRWFRQQGEAACLRCPQVVTDYPTLSSQVRQVADPKTKIWDNK
jgi:hypothetical protein